MTLQELKPILYSAHGSIQFAILYDSQAGKDIETGCTIDYLIAHYGDKDVKRIQAVDNNLIITI